MPRNWLSKVAHRTWDNYIASLEAGKDLSQDHSVKSYVKCKFH